MASYIPWHGKKREALADRERELMRVLRGGGHRDELARASEEVRSARIRFLKAERARLRPCAGSDDDRRREIDEAIIACRYLSADEIIDDVLTRSQG